MIEFDYHGESKKSEEKKYCTFVKGVESAESAENVDNVARIRNALIKMLTRVFVILSLLFIK